MNKKNLISTLGLSLLFAATILTAQDSSESTIQSNHYSARANAWIEGTLSKTEPNGAFTIRGSESPYARDFASFNRESNATIPLQRDTQRGELVSSYGDRLKYEWSNFGSKDFTFNNGNSEDIAIFEEPKYGRDVSTWSLRAEPCRLHFGDLNAGDRVVVGYDSFDSKIYSLFYVNPQRADSIKIDGPDK